VTKTRTPRKGGLTAFDSIYAVSDKPPHGEPRVETLSKKGVNAVNRVGMGDVDGEEPTRKPMPKANIFDPVAAAEMRARVQRKIERELKAAPCRRGEAGRVQKTR
jgi:hypothetical protein